MTRFSMVNRKGGSDHNPHYQRHHLIPLQAATISDLRGPLNEMASGGFNFDDFERNGVLLPADEKLALQTGRPLHRGPHPHYNELVIERLFLIKQLGNRIENTSKRRVFFHLRMSLLQAALRRALVGSALPVLRLNKKDPGLSSAAFADLDSCVDLLFVATQWPPRQK